MKIDTMAVVWFVMWNRCLTTASAWTAVSSSSLRNVVVTRSTTSPRASSTTSETTNSFKNETTKVHTITWKTPNNDKDIIFQAYDGELLRTAALRRGLASPHNLRANLVNCRGLGTCGTCAVKLTTTSTTTSNDNDWLPPRNTVESVRLAIPPGHKPENAQRLRLACQVAVHGDLTVQKFNGFWGQYYGQLVHPSKPTQPFGKAEFLLDRTSPPDE